MKTNADTTIHIIVVILSSVGSMRGVPNSHNVTNSEANTPTNHPVSLININRFVIILPSKCEYTERMMIERGINNNSMPSMAYFVASVGANR